MRLLLIVSSLAWIGLSCAMAQPATPRVMADRLSAADTNRDGRITRAEFLAYRAAQFPTLDRNRDGQLNTSDRPALRLPATSFDIDALIQAFDRNGDASVSRTEYESGPTPMFTAADLNQDGVVDAAELQAARSARS
ncbi:MAG: EF-hand domain-containing protein [Caulobacterales bacterium]|jgi:Ca2+-binding EF-hand superfamily protein